MFQDVGVSKDLNEQFRTHLQGGGGDPLDIDFQIQVKLSSLSWNLLWGSSDFRTYLYIHQLSESSADGTTDIFWNPSKTKNSFKIDNFFIILFDNWW